MKYALAVTNEKDAGEVLKTCLKGEYRMEVLDSPAQCLEKFKKRRYEFLFIDILILLELDSNLGEASNYRALIQLFSKILPSVEIIILCSQDTIRKAVEAVKAGASNYLMYPIDKKETRYIIETTLDAIKTQFELNYFRDQFWDSDSLRIVSTKNSAMRTIFDKVKNVAPANTTVLITGETGTGKGIIAKLIHSHSPRKNKQFISVHCGAIAENLIESELFGHEKGAFTGAVRRKMGKFEIARDGTLFLDEIATMPMSAQIKLLQVLQDKYFQRVGGEDNIDSEARIITASNVDLYKMIEKGEFRKDLFYRLNVFPIELPPLRDRKEDIPKLAEEFLFRLKKEHLKTIEDIHPEVLEAFSRYTWPGNIRELENLMERAYLLETSSMITPESFPGEIFTTSEVHTEIPLNTSLTLADVRKKSYYDIERNYLKELLAKLNGRIDTTAEAAGVSTRQLHKLLTRHGIRKKEFKTGKTIHAFRNKEFRKKQKTKTVETP